MGHLYMQLRQLDVESYIIIIPTNVSIIIWNEFVLLYVITIQFYSATPAATWQTNADSSDFNRTRYSM